MHKKSHKNPLRSLNRKLHGKKLEKEASSGIRQLFTGGTLKTLLMGAGGFLLFLVGAFLIWFSTLTLPNLDTFEERKIASSTKIYDRTGEIVLFNLQQNLRRTVVPTDMIDPIIKEAAIAIEDDKFYSHQGVRPKAILRALIYNQIPGRGTQGGSTITQQVIKMTLLTNDKNIVRKIKEAFLAIKLEQKLTKDEILTAYLNVVPYGGTLYGVEEASRSFFGKSVQDVTLAEAAYLASIPNAPTLYSPYGKNRARLDDRKNYTLTRMHELGFISETEMIEAQKTVVEFKPQKENYAKALHFVQYIREYLEKQYGKDTVENGGLKVISTLDYTIQQVAEETALANALKNQEQYKAENQAVVAIDPKTGHILAMVGSRNYSDTEIDGAFNVALAKRQPGSAFKPFIYAEAFKQGYLPETVVFDVRTQFQSNCPALSFTSAGDCYAPENYDATYKGPIALRNALAESRNIPAVKLLYLVGVENALKLAKEMGITTLGTGNQYGLTLVLGGGEVSLLEMTSAYGVFAQSGIYNTPTGIIRVEDKDGKILEEWKENSKQILDKNVALMVNDVLKDNTARTPLFGANSFFFFGNRDAAGKSGTTNNNRDAWIIGYTPNLVVGVWSGNNANTPMAKGSSISGPTWRAVMDAGLQDLPVENFEPYVQPEDFNSLKPILRGLWQGGEYFTIDTISGRLATDRTPEETRKDVVIPNVHSILHWVNRGNPRGPIPTNPSNDSQYTRWEAAITAWLQTNALDLGTITEKPTTYDNVHTEENKPVVTITHTTPYSASSPLTLEMSTKANYPIKNYSVFANGLIIGTTNTNTFTFIPNDLNLTGSTKIEVIATDEVYNKGSQSIVFQF